MLDKLRRALGMRSYWEGTGKMHLHATVRVIAVLLQEVLVAAQTVRVKEPLAEVLLNATIGVRYVQLVGRTMII
jgi:hypothetical protein